MKTSEQFLRLAHMTGRSPEEFVDRLMEHAADDFGVHTEAVQELLSPHNWLVKRPTIRVRPFINQAGNLVVQWEPLGFESVNHSETEFEPGYFSKYCSSRSIGAVGKNRPQSELMYFKEPSAYLGIAEGSPARPFAIICGIQARFDELVAQLSLRLTVHCTGALITSLRKKDVRIQVVANA